MAALRGFERLETETSTLCKHHAQTEMAPEYTFDVNMLVLGFEMHSLHCSGTVSKNDKILQPRAL